MTKKVALEWALQNPDFDFNSIFQTNYSNKTLFQWLLIEYENIFFVMEKYQKGEFVLTSEDVIKSSYLPEE